MPIEIKNLSIKINIANDENSQEAPNQRRKKKTIKKKDVIELVEQMHKLKNER